MASKEATRTAAFEDEDAKIVIVEHKGVKFGVKQQNWAIGKATQKIDDTMDRMFHSIIKSTFTVNDDGTLGEPVFTKADLEALQQKPISSTSLVGKISKALGEVNKWEEAAEAAKKSAE